MIVSGNTYPEFSSGISQFIDINKHPNKVVVILFYDNKNVLKDINIFNLDLTLDFIYKPSYFD